MKYLLFLLLLPSLAYARPMRLVNIVAINGEDALTDCEIIKNFKDTRYFTNQSNLKIKLNRFIRIDEISSYTTLETRLLRTYDYHKFTRAAGLHRHGAYTMYVVPPVKNGTSRYWLGVALTTCANTNQRTAYAVGMRLTSFRGASGMNMSRHVFAHELEHLLGASHDSQTQCNLMNPDPLACLFANTGYLELSETSKKQVKLCQRRHNG